MNSRLPLAAVPPATVAVELPAWAEEQADSAVPSPAASATPRNPRLLVPASAENRPDRLPSLAMTNS
jgi:hypothetical protein